MDGRNEIRTTGPTTVEVATASLRRISWGAVFAGTVVTIVVWFTLALLGMAIGLSAIDPAEEGTVPGRSLGVGAMIWWIISALVAMFVGSWVAGRLAGPQRRLDGALHGVATWGLGVLASLFLLTTAIGSVVGGAFGLVGNVANVGPRDVGMIRQEIGRALQDYDRDGRYDHDYGRGTAGSGMAYRDRDDDRDLADRRTMGTGRTGMGTDRPGDYDRDRGGVGVGGEIGADRSGGGVGVRGRAGDVSGGAGVRVDERGVTGTVRGTDDDRTTDMSGTVGRGGVSGQRTTTETDVDRTATGDTAGGAGIAGRTTGTGTTGMGATGRTEVRDMDDDDADRSAFATREQRMAESAAETGATAAMWGFVMLLLGFGAALAGGAIGSPRDIAVVSAAPMAPPPPPAV